MKWKWWQWLIANLYHREGGDMQTSDKGPQAVSVWARCPHCKDGYLKRHKCWLSVAEGDLMQCREVYKHYWVRDSDTRADERKEGERHNE